MSTRSAPLLLTLLLLFLTALVACETGPDPAPEQPPTGAATEPAPPQAARVDPLIVAIGSDEGPLTPANYTTLGGFSMVGWVYDPLFARGPDLEPVPALATSATQSNDGLTWKVKLRDDVTWHDGEPFTAADVVFSYSYLIDSGRAPNLGAVADIAANGDHSVTITLAEPDPFFLSEGLTGYYIMPEHIWRGQVPAAGTLSEFAGRIGTGPYTLEAVVPGESYSFRANPDYFRGPPQVANVHARIVPERAQQFTQLRSGAVHAVLSSIPPSQVGQLDGEADLTLVAGADLFNYVFYVNGSRPPFDRRAVRQAVAQAIDTQALVDQVLLARGDPLPLSWYHPALPWANDIPHKYDPAGAAAILDELGINDTDGDGVREYAGEPMAYDILCDANSAVERSAGELIAGWLQDIGIGATPACQEIETSVAMIWPERVAVPNPDYDMAIWSWSGGTQLQRGFLRGLLHCDFGETGWGNLTGLCDPELDALMDAYISEAQPARTARLVDQIQERLAANVPWIPLMSPAGHFAYRPAAYEDWVYVPGTGIMTAWSFLPPAARP